MTLPGGSLDANPRLFSGVWEGASKIVIGVDIGTTQSGVAFSFLETGSEQIIHRVTQWPGQEVHTLQSKIPSLVWYDTDKKAVSFGSEAVLPQTEEKAYDNEWFLAKHFKLHLHPSSLRNRYGLRLDPLPPGVSLQQVYADFLGYLLRHTQTFFEDRMVDGKHLWAKYRPTMEFIIAHPNGWEIREQTFLRTAAVKAGFTTPAAALTNIRFVTEAEASVHFCIYHTNLGSRLQPGMKFAVCDAGGSTVDTTVYSVISARLPLKLEEARASACVQAGAIFVNAAAEQYVRNALGNAELDEEDIDEFTRRGVLDFEKVLKRNFRGPNDDGSIEIANSRFHKPSIRTRRGHMTLPGVVVKTFFDVCVDEIKASIDQQLEGMTVSHILLVGGFGDSPYLRQEFKTRYESQGCQITLANDSTSKAVADGAIIWSTTDSVVGRAPRFSYGIETSARYNPLSADHQGREIIFCPSGQDKVHGMWSQIVAKDIVLDTKAVARESFSKAFSTSTPQLDEFKITLISYSGDSPPMWTRDKQGTMLDGFQASCVISANLASLNGALEPRIGANGNMYWRLYFEVCIRFGGTELEAYLEWEEKGKTRTSEVTIVPDHTVET